MLCYLVQKTKLNSMKDQDFLNLELVERKLQFPGGMLFLYLAALAQKQPGPEFADYAFRQLLA